MPCACSCIPHVSPGGAYVLPHPPEEQATHYHTENVAIGGFGEMAETQLGKPHHMKIIFTRPELCGDGGVRRDRCYHVVPCGPVGGARQMVGRGNLFSAQAQWLNQSQTAISRGPHYKGKRGPQIVCLVRKTILGGVLLDISNFEP